MLSFRADSSLAIRMVAVTGVLVGCIASGSAPTGSAAPSVTTPPSVTAANGTTPSGGTGPSSTASTDTPSLRPMLTGHAPCPSTPGFTCATLRVPLDHSRRTSGTLDLRVAIADNTDAPRGVLLMLAGGPGQPGVSLVSRIKNNLAPEVLSQYRMVMFDQRGTGPNGINCVELQQAIGGSDYLTPPRDAVVSCAIQLGSTRDFYGSPDTVEDIDWLRQALGQARITLNGTSYGTFTGANYALKYPGQVKALVLDSVVPHRGVDPFSADLMKSTGRVLADACSKDPDCTTDPVADLAWLVRNGEIDGNPINGTNFIESLAIISLSAVNPSFQGLPDLLHQARNGDTAPLKDLFQQLTSRDAPYDQLSAGLHMATFCSDLRFPWGTSATALDERQAALDKAVRRLDPADLYPYNAATARNMLAIEGCLNWLPAKPSSYPELQRLLPPTLILHGTNDLFCPVEWAQWTKEHSERAKLVVIPGGGHSIQSSRTDPTGKDEVKAFLLQ
jgi:pimeloyl-ACP methyl ester carboxylesterase